MKPQVTYYPHRFLFLLPILWLQAQFVDMTLSIIFGVILAFITSKMFPLVEFKQPNKDKK